MTINLLSVSTAKETDLILRALIERAGPRIGTHVHLGNVDADFKASSLSRMTTRRGKKGHLFDQNGYAGAALDLVRGADFERDLALFVEELYRRDGVNAYNGHKLGTLHDYRDYFHILADRAAELMREKEITHLLFFNVPHLAQDTVFYLVARAMGLQTLVLAQSLEPGKFFSMADPHDFGHVPFVVSDAAPYSIEKGEPLDFFYMSGVGQAKAKPGRLGLRGIAQFMTHVVTREQGLLVRPIELWNRVGRMQTVAQAFPNWRDPFAKFFGVNDLAYFEHLAGYEDQEIDLERRFVYFAMQLQPEMTTSSLGGNYVDQALALEHLRDMLPDDVAIYVKENPKQAGYARGPMFFHRLRRIPGLVFVPSFSDTKVLTERAEAVATVTGTVGWEAIRQGTPAIVFGETWYGSLPGVHRYRAELDFDLILAEFEHERLEAEAGALFARAHEGVVNRHYARIVEGFEADGNAAGVAEVLLKLLTGEAELSFSS